MPENGTYLLANVGFSNQEKPLLLLQNEDTFINFEPLHKTLTLRFDTQQRFCTGWRNITEGKRFACPDQLVVDAKYEQCSACQKRTGFNPAFYHATTVSRQQEARNKEPHILYLAHFSPGIIKVGISLAARERSRLLEQGARSAIILDTFPSAHIARQYEAQIAKLPGIVETIQQRKKSELITKQYDQHEAKNELLKMKDRIEEAIGKSFLSGDWMHFDAVYFQVTIPNLQSAHNTIDEDMISGKVIGALGTALFCTQQESLLYLPLKKYVGYRVSIDNTITKIEMPAQQISLF